MTVLVLGGTSEARELARVLVDFGQPVLSSLAGRVSRPALPPGRVRVGGFGGVDGLVATIAAEPVRLLIDATHPFAAQISQHAAVAAEITGCPLLRLQRPGWRDHSLASRWTWVPDAAAACGALHTAERPFLTSGRRSLEAFLPLADRDVLVRLVDPPDVPLPARWRVMLARGPYEPAGERAIMLNHDVDRLLTKDSGGRFTVAKLDAAAGLGIPVVIIERPAQPADVATVRTVDDAARWCLTHSNADLIGRSQPATPTTSDG